VNEVYIAQKHHRSETGKLMHEIRENVIERLKVENEPKSTWSADKLHVK